ncbi:MAG: NAD(P)-dependent oxidoreductase [Bacteroidota bacterium]
MNIFITGGTGFIGQHLCKRLVAEGHELTLLLRSDRKRRLVPTGVTFLPGDLTRFQDENLELPPFDVVIHLAGVVTAKDPADYDRINHQAVRDLVGCLERQSWRPKRLLFASSLAAAGPSELGKPHLASDPLNPVDPYGEAKKQAELFLENQTIPSTSFRPAIVLGPMDDATLTLYKLAKRRMGFQIGRQPQQLSFVDVDDVVDALIRMMHDERAGHFQYFIAHPQVVTAPEILNTIAQAMGKKLIKFSVPKWLLKGLMHINTFFSRIFGYWNQLDNKQYRQMTAPAFVCSSESLQTALDWNPQHDLEASVKKALKGYLEAGKL